MKARRSGRLHTAALGMLVACHDGAEITELPGAAFESWCGVREPVALLSLSDGEMIQSGPVARRHGDRLVFVVESPASSGGAARLSVRSAGACGEDPRVLLDDVVALQASGGFEEPVACDRDQRALLVPAGGAPVSVLFEGTGCDVWAVGDGAVGMVVGAGGRSADVVYRARLQSGDVEPLATGVRGPGELDGTPLAVAGLEVFFVDARDRLVAHDTTQHAEVVLAEAVGGFDVSADGRFVLVQALQPFTEGLASHAITLIDRDLDEVAEVGWGSLGAGSALQDEGFATAFADPALGGARLLLLPERTSILMGSGRAPVSRLSEDWMLLRVQPPDQLGTNLVIHDVREATDVVTFFGGVWLFALEDAFDVLARPNPAIFELWRWSPGDERPRFIAPVNGGYRRISDHQIVVSPDDGRAGDLVVLDERTNEQRRVDRDAWLGPRASSLAGPLGLSTVIYEVFAEDRRGVWAASLEPAK